MEKENRQIKELIDEGLSTISKMKILSNTPAGPNTIKLREIIKNLYPLISDDYPLLRDILSKAETKLIENGIINAFFFGDIRTSLKILKDNYSRPPKIFISHKSEDEAFVKALVKLLRLYIGSDSEKIFCSSVPNYKIGIGKAIYPEIKVQFEEHEVFMIIVHSPRYYQSPVCLNELGAAWIQNKECYSFLTTDCEYDDMKGVIDSKFISIKVNAEDATDRMNEFIYKVLNFFNLPQLKLSVFSRWESDRNEFLKEVCKLDLVEEQREKVKDSENLMQDSLSDFDKKHLKKWAECDDGECWIIETMDGSFIQIGEEEFCVNSGRERAEWDNFFERLIELGFAVIDRPNSDGSPIYKLKKSAYDYVESLKTEVLQKAISG
ncbi:MAG: toll/interleukin-1 receptor domain-containing protein [Bacteroidaceae bacterium]|nr:toll/interleukin-1 receptor domain-containing protein [Bacteroidaceae bacterium]